MKLLREHLTDVKVLQSPHFQDERGGFLKAFSSAHPDLSHYHIRQINYVNTKQKNIIRGLHFQPGHWESKFFRVVEGRIQVAFIDLRPDSPTYLQSDSVILDEPGKGVLIPRGCATGYCTLSEDVSVLYLSDNDYVPEVEKGLRWNDPLLKVDWQVQDPVISEKDAGWRNLEEQLREMP